tara:strand:- start:3976 stop:5349 length:1374 start_codon:yes stop_codon:yes gene_type:complete
MPKNTVVHVCQSCGHQIPKWLGRCPECGEWNTFVEESIRHLPGRSRREGKTTKKANPAPINQIEVIDAARIPTGIGEFDRVLGGGLVGGALVLLGGDPGIGKSTLVLQCMGAISKTGKKVLYVSGEESPPQIKMRAERLDALSDNLIVCSEICIEEILRVVDCVKPRVLVLDSIQTFFTQDLPSAPGSVGQVREVAFKIFQEIKARSLPVLLIGHVTKEGSLAGPKTLEHIVDTVVYFEGERTHSYRVLRAIKNRYGSTPETGVFEMGSDGLRSVDNPSEIFLSERPENAPGSAIVCNMEGTRPLLVEVQALVSPSSNVGMPRRMVAGIEYNRMSLLIAILEKRAGLHLQSEDIFVNIAGGIKITEPGVDLGSAAAIAGSFHNKVIDPGIVLIGEIGLTGEVRSIMQLEARILEAQRLGFKTCIAPHSANKSKDLVPEGIDVHYVKSIQQTFDIIFD